MATNIQIKKLTDTQQRNDPMFATLEAVMSGIRARAYELFSCRDQGEASALNDWLQAEREFSWPSSELYEADGAYQLKVALPGYAADQVQVAVTPQEIIVRAVQERKDPDKSSKSGTMHWSEFRSAEVCRRIELPRGIDVNQTLATLQDGMLTIRAVQASAARKVPVSVAA